jgi:hypothetical protein
VIPILETLGVALLAVGGGASGWAFARLRSRWWVLGYLLPLSVIGIIVAARWFRALEFSWLTGWLLAGRREYAIEAWAGTMVLAAPLCRLPLKRDRWAVGILAALLIPRLTLWPFLASLIYDPRLAALSTRLDPDGVCLQGTDFTCGPAAAVTLLRRLGWPAEEGDLALRCHTNPGLGTPPDTLASVLRARYGPEGLRAEYRRFRSLEELRDAGFTLAVVRFNLVLDHYVAVLQVTPSHVVVGDPLAGRQAIPREEFLRQWRFVGVVLRR